MRGYYFPYHDILPELVVENEEKIVFLVMDGLGGLGSEPGKPTELELASTPNLDRLAQRSSCGLIDPVAPGISPGSGPAHLALFGYDPVQYEIGRGVLSVFGARCFDPDPIMKPGDVAARMNFATLGADGTIKDRRAGRLSEQKGKELCRLLDDGIERIDGVEITVMYEKEYRAAVLFRGEGLSGALADTDPTIVDMPPIDPKPKDGLDPETLARAERTAAVVKQFVEQAVEILKGHEPANFVLLRGFDEYQPLPSFAELYRLSACAIATYPMYRGLARLLGMKVVDCGQSVADEISALEANWGEFDFFYVHIKKTDSAGEDGNADAKVKVIEEVDSFIPRILELDPSVLVVTGDHSTPATLKAHSWHPLPVLVHSRYARTGGAAAFNETECAKGVLGRLPSVCLMPIALANALRLKRYGA
ncbi:MAG TPA: 2,3-bisphosphoglycerate-independent phosphoglycerate mutase [Proteobacteria bacterium]|nr:2,3-bisphosphoglycerate-independent phosphoglycerate mutase [Pseudomonadota bacterium]